MYLKFPINKIEYLDDKTKKTLDLPNYKWLWLNGKWEPANYDNLLTRDFDIRQKQHYIMQIATVEKDLLNIEFIYKNWDWLEFVTWQLSIQSMKALQD